MTASEPEMRVLYVEDDPVAARLTQASLGQRGIRVDLARDGGEGLRMVREGAYDLVLLDRSMPVRDGLEVLAELRDQPDTPPIVMVTASDDAEVAVQALKLGAVDYVIKDVAGGYFELLPAVIERSLAQHDAQERARQAQEALRQSEAKHRAFMESSVEHVFMLDLSGVYLSSNDRVTQFGVTRGEELVGRHFSEVQPTPVARQYEELLRRVAGTGEPVTFEHNLSSPEGTRHHLDTLFPVMVAGQLEAIGGICRDITHLKKTEQALRAHRDRLEEDVAERTRQLARTNERLVEEVRQHEELEVALRESLQQWQATFDAISDPICLLDPEGHITRCNRAMVDFLGGPQEQFLGRACYQVVHGTTAPLAGCPFAEMRRTNARSSSILQIRGRWYVVAAHPMPGQEGELVGAVHIMSDITDRKLSEEAREAAERELEQQRVLSLRTDRLRSLGEMAAGMAHELNQPLSGVRGLAEHLLLSLDRGWSMPEERTRQKLQLIVEQADRMSHMIDHVRLFARESGRPELKPTSVNDVVRSSVGMLSQQFKAHGLLLRTQLADGLPPVMTNPFSLEEVLLNLLTNARDALEQQEGCDSSAPREAVVQTAKIGGAEDMKVRIRVVDSGVGVTEDAQPKVFDPFFTTKSPDKGTGLGLAICRSIVDQFGGTIELDSSPGVGTTVTVSLPAGSPEPDTPPARDPADSAPPGQTGQT